jgi:hypothetical protein
VLVRSGKGGPPQPGADAEPDAAVDASTACPDCSKADAPGRRGERGVGEEYGTVVSSTGPP